MKLKIETIKRMKQSEYPNLTDNAWSIWFETGAGDMNILLYDSGRIELSGHNGLVYPHIADFDSLAETIETLPRSIEEVNATKRRLFLELENKIG